MNRWKLSKLKALLNIKKIININEEDITYDYLKIVNLNNIKYEDNAENVLYFFVYSEPKDITDEFIINPFDQRLHADEIIEKYPNYTFVIDEHTFNNLHEKNKKAKFIVVENILNSIDTLYKYVMDNKNNTKVIAVTGSVGKTTTVGMIENVVRQKYNVFRIYSKRITPIILKANIINFINQDIDFVTIEMSIFHHDHVEILSDILKPDIAALIGVDSSHLEFFSSIDDICHYKASIFRYATVGFYNNLDIRVNNLELDQGTLLFHGEKIYSTLMTSFNKIAENYSIKDDVLEIDNNKIRLFFNTELSIIQSLLAYKIGKLLDIENKKIVQAINNYEPVENRISQKVAFGKNIIFDGDITTHERIKQLSQHNYNESYLVIRKFGSAENNKRFEHVLGSLDKFTKVFVFGDIEYLKMLSSHPKVVIVNNHDFMQELKGQIIYHYSGYYRSFKKYDENNLIELENEKYPILKPEEE